MKKLRAISSYLTPLLLGLLLNAVSANDKVVPTVLDAGIEECFKEHVEELADHHPTTASTIELLKSFAETYHLPIKYVETGPPERRVKRMVVGLDFHNWDTMRAYMRWFHLEGSGDPTLGGVLPLEYAYESDPQNPNAYVGTSVRPRPDENSPIWMFGRADVSRMQWWDNSVMHPQIRESNAPVVGFAHLIGVTPEEQKNIWHFLSNPQERAACKSGNCVAWQSQIELGQTFQGATDDQRKFLATELGFSRTVEHREITRRMWHYANDRHGAVVAFLNGERGVEEFKNNLAAYLPESPKIPAKQAVKGVTFAKNPELDAAMSVIKDVPGGAHVFLPIGAGASPEGMESLGAIAGKLKHGLDVHVLVNGISERVFNEALTKNEDKLRIHALFLGGNLRKAYSEGRVHYVPGHLADFSRYARDPDNHDFRYDVIVVRVSPPNKDGHYSLGQNSDMIQAVIASNPKIKVIAEINPNVPFTNGDNYLTDSQLTSKFHSETPLGGPASVPVTPIEANIGKNLALLVPDQSTLQVGIGNVFGGLADGLKNEKRHGIKIRTEMMGDDLAQVMQNGNAISAQTGFGFGSADFYRWLDHNPKVTLVPTEEVNDPAKIQKINNYVAVNTAIQVDLFGQVNATMGPAERGRISSPGGQVEFMSGASRSKGGKAIIALRSTVKNDSLSTITLDLYPGPITTPAEYVTHVVTEYGTAELAGKSDRQRAINLINISHPKFRKQLAEQAVTRKILRESDLSQINFDTPVLETGHGPSDHSSNRVENKDASAPTVQQQLQQGELAAAPPLKPEQINYKVYGDENKPTIVLIHGLGDSLNTWNKVAPLLAKDYRVVVYDQRGHGLTPDVGENYSSSTMAGDLEALLDHLHIQKATLLGHSMGGRTAIRFASLHPDRVQGLIVEDMHVMGRKTLLDDNLAKSRALKEQLKDVYPDMDSARAALTLALGEDKAKSFPLFQEPDGTVRLKNRPWVTPLYYNQGQQEDLSSALKSIHAPVLFVRAESQETGAVLHGKGVENIEEVKPDAKIIMIPKSGHAIHKDKPSNFLDIVTDFLKSDQASP